ncbi:MAG: T9SS type A sorting domain-containing protein [Rhodothermia bacterium]|nr:T9SS type A sorting domain-containing protein [Rhodothermia bacterium]
MKRKRKRDQGDRSRLALLGISLCLLGSLPAAGQTLLWEETGGPEGGIVNTFHVHTDGTVLAATTSGVIFYSTNNGVTWSRASSDITETVQAFESLNAGEILAGVGEGGTYVSSDGGATWTKKGFGTTDVTSLRNVPTVGLLVGTSYTSSGGIYRSTDGGEGGMLMTSFGNDAVVSEIVWTGNVFAAAAQDAGLRVSTNGGFNWTLQTLPGNPVVVDVAVSGNGTFFALANNWSSGTEGEVFRSTDNGLTWTSLDPTPGQNGWVQDIAINDAGDIFVTSDIVGISVSSDNGDSWTPAGSGGFSFPARIAIAANQDLLVTAEPDGIYRSSDMGATWSPSFVGFVDTSVETIANTSDGTFFVSANSRLYRSATGTGPWVRIDTIPLESSRALAIASNDDIYVGEFFGGDVYKSSDGGNSWMPVAIPLFSDWEGASGIWSVEGGEVFIAGRTRPQSDLVLARSTNNGTTWSNVTPALDKWQDPVSIREAPNGDLYLVTQGPGNLYRSVNRGATWTQTAHPEVEFLNDVVFHPGGTTFTGGDGGMRRSTDAGATWELKSDGLPVDEDPFFGSGKPFVRSMTIASNGVLYISAPQGTLFRTFDNGDTWFDMSEGIPGPPGRTFAAMHIKDNRVYLGTQGSGVVRSSATATDVEQLDEEVPKRFALEQNYPNPFNPTTSIEMEIPIGGHVSLVVYDMLGREVATLIDETVAAGVSRVSFDAGILPSGTYLYRLTTPVGAATRSMTLLK